MAHEESPGSPNIQREPPSKTFGLLADETRVEILRALSDGPPEGQTFSALFESVSQDDSGNFNYHLSELVGSFVAKTDGHYQLTYAGRMVVGAMLAGTYDAETSIAPLHLDWECLQCGGAFSLGYEDGYADLRCQDCDEGATISIPPGALESVPREELPAAVARWYRARMQRIRSGFCQVCAGPTERRLIEGVDPDAADPSPSKVSVECRRCGAETKLSGATLVTYHPVVEGFFREHGMATRRRHPSQLWRTIESSVETVSTAPLVVEVTFCVDDESITARIGHDGSVQDIQRERSE
jgi:DNA-binding transcriptional ArsR family regulator